MMDVAHKPVMMNEVMNYLDLKPGKTIVDCTIGLGGHSEEIMRRISPGGRLVGIDRDSESLEMASQRLKSYAGQCTMVWDDFRNLDKILAQLELTQVDGIVLDLGVSSYQFDNPERGFSIKADGPLDMRMDRKSYISAYDLVNSLSEKEISSILKTFGQEHWHNRIAHLMVEQRSRMPISTTGQLSDIVLRAMPYTYRRSHIHPATRTFQAFRIAVNRELEALELILDKSVQFLSPGGRLCVLSFHSLEDRIVKNRFRLFATDGMIRRVVKKPLSAGDEELQQNPRARSAKLRVAVKI